MTIVLYQIFLHTKIRVEHFPDILVHCLLFHRNVVEHRHNTESSSSDTNFEDMSNNCLSVRSVVFAMELRLFWKFFPMNIADSIVTAVNIFQIIECSSPFPATLEILFCLFFVLDHSPDSRMILILQTIQFCCIASQDDILRV